ncbi:MAG: hypothetical protein KDA41_03955, partial [Planctomycetales bacterium]|nr:hypothetical protein [Planctomycetales bacterium]
MDLERIEKLKQDYTDKYVAVVAGRPELARFNGLTGVVKTVNMSGRALVEFDGNANIGWYDIALDFLKLLDKPLAPKAESKEARAEAKAAPTKPAAPAAKPAAGGKMSTADILAAARAKAAGGAAKPAGVPAAKPASTPSADKPTSTAD